ncbi:hypothetical protein L873DRAFT_1848113 [Choiromyces venosus 120613-1]|uniref:Uncharacterized protein n=1 Tax=Choiromyces venosus 120613-1 TaxID=1336337 RepID=A0A3N4J530_9PEZI|nr:hypothetical protein L873DRAFT_1848113 [Choiromyces venosus 120613-1]
MGTKSLQQGPIEPRIFRVEDNMLNMTNDIRDIKKCMEQTQGEFKLSVEKMRGEFKLSMEQMRGESKLSMEQMRREFTQSAVKSNGTLNTIKWQIGVLLTMIVGGGTLLGFLLRDRLKTQQPSPQSSYQEERMEQIEKPTSKPRAETNMERKDTGAGQTGKR